MSEKKIAKEDIEQFDFIIGKANKKFEKNVFDFYGMSPEEIERRLKQKYLSDKMQQSFRDDPLVSQVPKRHPARRISQNATETHPARKTRVEALPPGGRITRLAELLLPRKFVTYRIKPQIGDMREECFEALSEGKPRLAQWLLVKCHFWLFVSLVLSVPEALAKKVRGAFSSED